MSITATSGTRSSSRRSACRSESRLPDVEALFLQLLRQYVGKLRLVLDE